MTSVFLISVSLCLSSGLLAADGQAPCPPGWAQFGSRCFSFNIEPKSWPDAETFCQTAGGNLASIHSAEEHTFIRNYIKQVTGSFRLAWIGGHDTVKEGTWLWADGSTFNYTSWAAGQPDNFHGGEHCTSINWDGNQDDISLPDLCVPLSVQRTAGCRSSEEKPNAPLSLSLLVSHQRSYSAVDTLWKQHNALAASGAPPDEGWTTCDCSIDRLKGRSINQGMDTSSSEETRPKKAKEPTPEMTADAKTLQMDMKNMQRELDKLKDVMSEECFKSAQRLVDKTPTDPDLLRFLLDLNTDLLQKYETGPKTSERSDEPGYKAKTSSSSSSSWGKTVKVFQVVTGRTFGADQEILEQVKNVGWPTTWKVETTRNLQECDVITVFCPIMSRVGSDVEAAMREDSVSSGSTPVILVLLHHTRDPDYSTDVRRWSETFQNVVLDVHVLFHETQPGLLRCKRNDRAVKHIQEELKKHSRW